MLADVNPRITTINQSKSSKKGIILVLLVLMIGFISLQVTVYWNCSPGRETDSDIAKPSAIQEYKTLQGKRIAILTPFVSHQIPKLLINWKQWLTSKPCTDKTMVTFILLYNGNIDDESIRITDVSLLDNYNLIEDKIPTEGDPLHKTLSGLVGIQVKKFLTNQFNHLQQRIKCLESAEFKIASANTPAYLDRHPEGPCHMFFTGLKFMKQMGFEYMIQMEPDVIPIRNNWAQKVEMEVQKLSMLEGWQMGSQPRCNPLYSFVSSRKDFHINGNSLYKIGDAHFEEYISKIQSYYPAGNAGVSVAGCATGHNYESGYDHTMYRYRMEPENWKYSQSVLHKFIYSDFIQNMCEDVYDVEEIRNNHPNTYLIHSKSFFYSKGETVFRKEYQDIIGKAPDVNSYFSKTWIDKMNENEDVAALRITLCLSDEHVQRYKNVGIEGIHEHCFKLCENSRFIKKMEKRLTGLCDGFSIDWDHKYPNQLYLWTSDFHAAPIACNREVMKEAQIVTHAEIDYGNCIYFTDTCRSRLKVLRHDNWRGFSLDPCPISIRKRFFNAYKNDPEMKRVDAVICSHPVSNCELYLPFNKTIIIYATTRLEFGRNDKYIDWRKPYHTFANTFRWQQWIENLMKIAKNPRNIIAANNLYDVHYIRYHTGIDVEYIPSWCGDLHEYRPSRSEILLGPYRDNLDYPRFSEEESWNHPIMKELTETISESGSSLNFVRMKQRYPKYSLNDLAQHRAIVLIPYQTSFMSFFEFYRMNIPLFVPSKKLLVDWQLKYNNMFERVYGNPKRLIKVDNVPNPNTNQKETLEYWLDFCDFYQFPHITRFDSWQDLIQKIETTNLKEKSKGMKEYNIQQRSELVTTWTRIKHKIEKLSGLGKSSLPKTIEEGLALYGLSIGRDILLDGNDTCSPEDWKMETNSYAEWMEMELKRKEEFFEKTFN